MERRQYGSKTAVDVNKKKRRARSKYSTEANEMEEKCANGVDVFML